MTKAAKGGGGGPIRFSGNLHRFLGFKEREGERGIKEEKGRFWQNERDKKDFGLL